ncbi:MAG: GC-type dockerin domain-anchored protein [Planctomycetota bacterium]
MRTGPAIVCSLFFSGVALGQAAELNIIARQGEPTPVPGRVFSGLLSATPIVDDSGRVWFNNDAGGRSLYRYTENAGQKVLQANETTAGGFTLFDGGVFGGDLSVNAAGQAVFVARLRPIPSGDTLFAIARFDPAQGGPSGTLTLLSQPGDAAPVSDPVPVTISGYERTSDVLPIDSAGRTVFFASLEGDGLPNGDYALVRAGEGPLELVYRREQCVSFTNASGCFDTTGAGSSLDITQLMGNATGGVAFGIRGLGGNDALLVESDAESGMRLITTTFEPIINPKDPQTRYVQLGGTGSSFGYADDGSVSITGLVDPPTRDALVTFTPDSREPFFNLFNGSQVPGLDTVSGEPNVVVHRNAHGDITLTGSVTTPSGQGDAVITRQDGVYTIMGAPGTMFGDLTFRNTINAFAMNRAGQIAFNADVVIPGEGNGEALFFYDPATGLHEIMREGETIGAVDGVGGIRADLIEFLGAQNSGHRPVYADGLGDTGLVAFTVREGSNDSAVVTWQLTEASPCVPDITTDGTNPGDAGFGDPDGAVTVSDLTFFVEAWLASDLGIADVTTDGTNPGDAAFGTPDGAVTVSDLTFFVEAWLGGCP